MSGISDKPRHRRWWRIAILIAPLVLLLAWQGKRHSVADDTPATEPAAEMVRISGSADPAAGNQAAPWLRIDRASVDWDKVHVEPDPSPFCFAAYGD